MSMRTPAIIHRRLRVLASTLSPSVEDGPCAAVPTPWGTVGALRTSDDVDFRSKLSDGPDADTCAEFFLDQGFLLVDNILTGDALATAQAAYRAALEPERRAWAAAVQAGEAASPGGSNTAAGRYNAQYFDLPRILEQHDCFLDIIAHPRIISVLERVVGPDVQVLNVQCRNYPPQDLKIAQTHGAYSGWHNDRGYGVLFNNAKTLHVVVIFTFFDVAVDGGCTAVVPESHRMCAHTSVLCPPASLPLVCRSCPVREHVVDWESVATSHPPPC